ncbi:TPA: hypothetical protein RQJ82_004272 [Vibrio vulnificus]|uniref:hypothetical protein n=1 Tax=Vibrio vulnificus TaxID=672 RepID=UPI0010232C7A|nr:hypothetical protein [Vibrio vulnificus]RZP59827.1 hypothetical protein D8T45_19080 [Vibrio vulnificus]RZR08425.1 hypothetical protein D8T24_21705 [Vibrio vulnificus]HDY7621978.1 hypothetical protein [Vibrio vulnificus]
MVSYLKDIFVWAYCQAAIQLGSRGTPCLGSAFIAMSILTFGSFWGGAFMLLDKVLFNAELSQKLTHIVFLQLRGNVSAFFLGVVLIPGLVTTYLVCVVGGRYKSMLLELRPLSKAKDWMKFYSIIFGGLFFLVICGV